jgi:hypothetical protein
VSVPSSYVYGAHSIGWAKEQRYRNLLTGDIFLSRSTNRRSYQLQLSINLTTRSTWLLHQMVAKQRKEGDYLVGPTRRRSKRFAEDPTKHTHGQLNL